MNREKNSKLVYSTNPDALSEEETHQEPKSSSGGTVYIERDRKKRQGKVVTVISGIHGNLKEVQKDLQKQCGAGGSVKNNTIEIQGDHRDKIAQILQNKGFKTKFIGG